jgi:hypothetical protein
MSIAGPLQFAIAWRLLSYYASLNLLSKASVIPVFALQRPFLPSQPWTSDFSIAPQLGWKSVLFNYGATQIRERVIPSIHGRFEGAAGESILFCEPPEPRLKTLRKGAAIALQIATAVPIF